MASSSPTLLYINFLAQGKKNREAHILGWRKGERKKALNKWNYRGNRHLSARSETSSSIIRKCLLSGKSCDHDSAFLFSPMFWNTHPGAWIMSNNRINITEEGITREYAGTQLSEYV